MPDKGWFAILRLYSPLQSFFDKSWQVGEFEPARKSQIEHEEQPMTNTQAAVSDEALASISTPDRVESRLGHWSSMMVRRRRRPQHCYTTTSISAWRQAFLGALRGPRSPPCIEVSCRWAQRTTRSCCSPT